MNTQKSMHISFTRSFSFEDFQRLKNVLEGYKEYSDALKKAQEKDKRLFDEDKQGSFIMRFCGKFTEREIKKILLKQKLGEK